MIFSAHTNLARYFIQRPFYRMISKEILTFRMIASYSTDSVQNEVTEDYTNAINNLNRLQSNAAAIYESTKSGISSQNLKYKETIMYLEKSGISLEELDKLSVIHVSGTKGKVSYIYSIKKINGLF